MSPRGILAASGRACPCLFQFRQHLVEVEARGLLPHREFREALQPLRGERLHRHLDEGAFDHPSVIKNGVVAAFERIGAQVEQLRQAQVRKLTRPDADALVILLKEDAFPLVDPDRNELAVIVPETNSFRGASLASPLKKGIRLKPSRWTLKVLSPILKR